MKIYLIGLPGSGKSYWARQLSAHYQLRLIDLDAEIVKDTGRSINDIFINHGEQWFRQKEADLLRQISQKYAQFIFSTGGGAPCFHQNMKYINENGISIFINRTPENIALRLLSKGFDKRPLLKDKRDTLVEELKNKLAERIIFYQQAHIVVEHDELKLQDFTIPIDNLQKK
ncbi:MAG: shikimate kinase [Cyclobacteriaceae bacterium]